MSAVANDEAESEFNDMPFLPVLPRMREAKIAAAGHRRKFSGV
jgi:hypothetical protein